MCNVTEHNAEEEGKSDRRKKCRIGLFVVGNPVRLDYELRAMGV